MNGPDKVVTFENTELPDLIELKGVCQSYDGEKTHVLKDVNWLIEDKPKQGQFIALLGPSGCGKSTILRYLAGLQKPTCGEILFAEKPNRPRVGMIFQRYSCFPWLTVAENILLGMEVNGIPRSTALKTTEELIAICGLRGTEKRYAEYPKLSGGQLQRVAIATQLAMCPKILLLDEPFGALDIKTRIEMQNLINDIWNKMSDKYEETTFIMVTHDVEEAIFLADEIHIMGTKPWGHFEDRIHVPFAKDRKQSIKSTDEFIKLSRLVREIMFTVSG